jgi:hypothetical protein
VAFGGKDRNVVNQTLTIYFEQALPAQMLVVFSLSPFVVVNTIFSSGVKECDMRSFPHSQLVVLCLFFGLFSFLVLLLFLCI